MLFSLSVVIFLFSGCQYKSNILDKGTQYEKGLKYTKVKSLIYQDINKAIINVTYLNSINNVKWDNKKQNFLVGIYIEQDHKDPNKQFINNPNYSLFMNSMNYKDIIQINKKEKQYSHIPLENPWAKYYIISFDNDNKNIVKLQYSYNNNEKRNLKIVTFQFDKE